MIRGEISVPADKSITHRAILFGALANGETRIATSLVGRDNLGTLRIMQQLGVEAKGEFNSETLELARSEQLKNISSSSDSLNHITVSGKGFGAFTAPKDVLNCGNSGTTARLLTGVLAAQKFSSALSGDESLSKRPFRRVMAPLSAMGAEFSNEKMPFAIQGRELKGIRYESPIASAQIKSAILLAGIQTSESITVIEPARTRDHTERMFQAMGCVCEETALPDGRWQVSLPSSASRKLKGLGSVNIPGDFSSAAFFLVLGSIAPDADILIANVGVNPTRTGLAHILKRMGAQCDFQNQRIIGGEPVADIRVKSAKLLGVEVGKADVVLSIDEIPALSIAAACANGVTRVTGAEELRVKESDRISMIASLLTSFGVRVEELPDGLVVHGLGSSSKFSEPKMDFSVVPDWTRCGDHRILMCGALLRFLQSGRIEIFDRPAVETSFPNFVACLEKVSGLTH